MSQIKYDFRAWEQSLIDFIKVLKDMDTYLPEWFLSSGKLSQEGEVVEFHLRRIYDLMGQTQTVPPMPLFKEPMGYPNIFEHLVKSPFEPIHPQYVNAWGSAKILIYLFALYPQYQPECLNFVEVHRQHLCELSGVRKDFLEHIRLAGIMLVMSDYCPNQNSFLNGWMARNMGIYQKKPSRSDKHVAGVWVKSIEKLRLSETFYIMDLINLVDFTIHFSHHFACLTDYVNLEHTQQPFAFANPDGISPLIDQKPHNSYIPSIMDELSGKERSYNLNTMIPYQRNKVYQPAIPLKSLPPPSLNTDTVRLSDHDKHCLSALFDEEALIFAKGLPQEFRNRDVPLIQNCTLNQFFAQADVLADYQGEAKGVFYPLWGSGKFRILNPINLYWIIRDVFTKMSGKSLQLHGQDCHEWLNPALKRFSLCQIVNGMTDAVRVCLHLLQQMDDIDIFDFFGQQPLAEELLYDPDKVLFGEHAYICHLFSNKLSYLINITEFDGRQGKLYEAHTDLTFVNRLYPALREYSGIQRKGTELDNLIFPMVWLILSLQKLAYRQNFLRG